MTEEVKVEAKLEPEVIKEDVVNETEQRALSMGWRPKDDWQGAEDDFIDAKEFVRRKPLFDRIEQTTKRLKNVEETLTNLASHHQKVKELEFQRALKTLRDERRGALKDGDTVAALEVEDKMEEITQTHTQELEVLKQQAAQDAKQNTGPSQDYHDWVKVNEWYLKDEDMHEAADGAATNYIQKENAKGRQPTESEVFNYVLTKVKKTFPDKFDNPNRQRPGTITTGDRGGKGIKVSFTPTAEEEQIAQTFEKQGIMKKDEYYKELRATRENV